MELKIHTHDLRLRHTFRIAHDVRDIQQTVIVELRDGGLVGYGEATANKYYGRPIESIIEALEENRALIEAYDYQEPEAYWGTLKPAFGERNFGLCAIDVAIHDLYARKQGVSLQQLWGKKGTGPNTCYTIGIDTVEKMVAKMLEFPWPVYKVKLGTDEDLKIIRELRSHTDAIFRVDANCGWSAEETISNSKVLRELKVEFIEQPLPAEDWEGMKSVHQEAVLPIVADESCILPSDVSCCHGYFHGINIKLMKCGGLTPALGMIRQARQLGLQIMVGCMTESSVGISAIGQLLPQIDYVDMDGFMLIDNDPGKGPWAANGQIQVPDSPGTGVMYLG